MTRKTFTLIIVILTLTSFNLSHLHDNDLTEGTIVNLYDAFGKDASLTKDWGFSCIIKYNGKTILFDAGSNADIFKSNVNKLRIDLTKVDIVVVSHAHFDHLNGIDYLLTKNPKVKIYLPNEFLERTDESKLLLKEFCKHYEVDDWKEFLKRISGLSFLIFKKEKDGHLELTVPNDESFESNIKFLDRLAAIKYDELTDSDFKVLRERPLHKISEGKYRIISELFTVERIFKGLYFNLKAVNATLKQSEKVKDLRFLYTFHFSEKQVCYEILGRIFPKKYLSFNGEELDKAGFIGAPDYYVRNNNKIFVFESKDSLLNAALKESGDYASIEPELIKKFYQDGRDAKAINQLLAFIKSMLTKTFMKWDNNYKLDSARIYPIIVIHDRQLDVPGLNKIINFWYFNELEKLKKEFEIKSKIYPITIMTVSTLILAHEVFRDRRLLFEEMIEEYHEFTKVKDPRHFGSQRQFEKHVTDTGLPFSNFIKGQVKKKNLPRIPVKMIKEKAIIALDS